MDKLTEDHQEFSTTKRKPLSTFVKKLWMIVNDQETNELIRWSDDGGDIWILDANQFSKAVLPCYFKHSNWHSFVRQLNLYGFRKVCDMYPVDQDAADLKHRLYDNWQFRHRSFQRNQPDLMHQVKRNRKDRRLKPGAFCREQLPTVTDFSTTSHDSHVVASDSQQHQQYGAFLQRIETLERDVREIETRSVSVQESLAEMRHLQYGQSRVLNELLGLTKVLIQTPQSHDHINLQAYNNKLDRLTHECQVYVTQLAQTTREGSTTSTFSTGSSSPVNDCLFNNPTLPFDLSHQQHQHKQRIMGQRPDASTLPFASTTIHQNSIRLPPLSSSCHSF